MVLGWCCENESDTVAPKSTHTHFIKPIQKAHFKIENYKVI